MSSRPRVYCRIRPLNERESAVDGEKECFFGAGGNTLVYKKEKDGETVRSRFDSVLGPGTDQGTMHRLLQAEVVSSLFKGYNATVFAYGQTGSGKTHTMEGDKVKGSDQTGLIPRLVNDLFSMFRERSEDVTNVRVSMSYVQIYQDQIQDLLQARKLLDIKLDKSGSYIANGALWKEISSSQQAMGYYYDAGKNRATSATEMNLISSRSHAILQFHLQWDETMAPGSNAKLNLVDLAGSEKVALSGATGAVLKEAIAINKSLSSLSNVIKALVDQAQNPARQVHVPYKDSKLTYLLQSSLGGNNLIHFILCLSASTLYRNEGNSTVEFGKRALKVVLKPVKNPIDYKRLEEMERMIEQMRKHISDLEGRLNQRGGDGLGGGGLTPGAAPGMREASRDRTAENQFLVMERIVNQEADDDDPARESWRQRRGSGKVEGEEIVRAIKDLETQQELVKAQLLKRDEEIGLLHNANAREKQALRSQYEQEKSRYARELEVLQSSLLDQRNRLTEKEAEQKATAWSQADARSRKKSDRSLKATNTRQKSNQELDRIFKALPESLHELTSHCILFPSSRARFREVGGLKKLLSLIETRNNKGRESYIAHAAYAISIALDEEGREELHELNGIQSLSDVLIQGDEHGKHFACRALEAAVRGCPKNKLAISDEVLKTLCDIVGTHPHQQVQEAACSVLAEAAEDQPGIKDQLLRRGLLTKIVSLVRETPAELADLIKVSVTVIGRLAQQHLPSQVEVARVNGIQILADVLFSPVGERDPQLPVLTAYALVNVCCSNQQNMIKLQAHPKYNLIQHKLLEGLARVFSDNIVSENRVSATASHVVPHPTDKAKSLFAYHGVTLQSEWSPSTAGGRPTYATFLENPQFVLSAPKDCNISIVLTDTACDDGLRKTARGRAGGQSSSRKTIYMGIALFKGDRQLLSDRGLKQLDFNGKFVTSGRYNRNRENTLSLALAGSDEPYVIVPFTAHCAQHTSFVLGVFSDEEIEVTRVPDEGGWLKRVFEGSWLAPSAKGVDAFEWRNADQYRIVVQEPTLMTVVLSYSKVDDFRVAQARRADDEEVPEGSDLNEETKPRPHLHGRIFKSGFAPEKRFVRSNIPSPQNTSFLTCNEYLSASSVKTAMLLEPNTPYVYIPLAETPCTDDYRAAFYTDTSTDSVSIVPLNPRCEWYALQFKGSWPVIADAAPENLPFVLLTGTGKVTVIGSSRDVYLLLAIYEVETDTWPAPDGGEAVSPPPSGVKTAKISTSDAYWANECVLEVDLAQLGGLAAGGDARRTYWVTLQGIKTLESGEQRLVSEGDYHIAVYAEDIGLTARSNVGEGSVMMIDKLTASPGHVTYGREAFTGDTAGGSPIVEIDDSGDDDRDSAADGDQVVKEENEWLRGEVARLKEGMPGEDEIAALRRQIEEKDRIIDSLVPSAAVASAAPPQPGRKGSFNNSRRGSNKSVGRQSSSQSMRGNGSNAARTLRSGSAASSSTASGDVPINADLASLTLITEQLARKVSQFASLDRPPSAVVFKKLQLELQSSATKLTAAAKRAAAGFSCTPP
ncbi:Kinesin-like protein KIN-1 [Diplonema papillatum]|nr:Kinesin-like protein KIN-1 [Diplonema papillatum]